MSGGREIDKAIDKLESEIRMLKLRVSELADEQPATVAPDADLHPVALKLAEAYRLAWADPEIGTELRRDIRVAWLKITNDPATTNEAILAYGKR